MNDVPLLECDSLEIGYGDLVVGRDISFQLHAGQVMAILGPNGAGKTTLMLTLAGFLPKLGGTFRLDGKAPKRPSAQLMNQRGVVLVPDSRALFTQLTTEENLALAARSGGVSVDEAFELFPALQPRARLKSGALSGGEQQMLAMARSLVQGPRVLLIDEMSMGLAPIIVESLIPVVRRVADERAAAVVLVEQHVRLALEVADHALVMVHGDILLSDDAARLRADPATLSAAYLGQARST